MNLSKEAVRNAIKEMRLRAEVISIADRIGVSILLSAVAEFWILSKAAVDKIDTDARKGIRKAPVAILTPLPLCWQGGGAGSSG